MEFLDFFINYKCIFFLFVAIKFVFFWLSDFCVLLKIWGIFVQKQKKGIEDKIQGHTRKEFMREL